MSDSLTIEEIEQLQYSNKIPLPTAADILQMDLPDPVWVIPGYIPAGLTILAARPKVGKSWFAMQIAHSVVTGQEIFDQQVSRGNVLYLALEDNTRRLQSRLRQQGWKAEESAEANFLVFEEFRQYIGFLNKGGAVKLETLIKTNKYRFIVVDTLSRAFAGIKDINDSQDVTAAIAPLQSLAMQTDSAILCIDHHNKASFNQDPVDDVMASTAKSAVADTLLGIYIEQGKPGATLKGRGRDIEEIDKRMRFDSLTGKWQIEGNRVDLEVTDNERKILTALHDLGKSKASAISAFLGANRGNTSERLSSMYTRGKIGMELIGNVSYYFLRDSE